MRSNAPHEVQFVVTKHLPIPPTYRWHEKVKWKIINLFGGVDPLNHQVVRIVRTPIDADKFMDKLYKQRAELFNRFDKEGASLLIGADDYEELMSCRNIQHMFSFNGDFNYGSQICGLKVTVVPWMRGIVVMP